MIGREWERRKAWSGPALIRRGPDFYAKCEALYVPKYAQGTFLLFSFEGSILHKKAAKDKFFWARRKARRRSGATSRADNDAQEDLDKLNPAAMAGWPTCSHPEHRS